jgi:diacylglycerol kinase (ATP)
MKRTPYARRGWARIVAAARNSLAGLRQAWRFEEAFRQEVALAAVMLPAAALAPVSLPERLLLAGSVILVLIVELLNSAIETVVDRISLEHHDLSARAKDIGSAAVMLALLLSAAVWAAILAPVLFAR